MRRQPILVPATLLAGGLLATAAVLALAPAIPGASAQGASPSPCTVASQMGAMPDVVPLGYSTRVTMSLRADCPVTATVVVPLHLVLVLDGSGSMAGERTTVLKAAARQFVADLDLDHHPLRQIGVVDYSSRPTTLCQLTNDSGRLNACINKLGTSGGTAIDLGIREALKVLTRGRPSGRTEVHQIMVVLCDGGNNSGCNPVLQSAGQAKGQKVLMIAIAVGLDSDRDCLRQVATSPRYYYEADRNQDLPAVFSDLAALVERVEADNLGQITVHNLLPPNMRYVADTVAPDPVASDPTYLDWRFPLSPGMTTADISLWVTPLELGEHPLSAVAEGALRDGLGQQKAFSFPIPKVRVVDNAGVPTPTPFPTRTPTPTVTPTITPTPKPVTPTPVPPLPRQCPGLDRLVPRQAIDDALANPGRVGGWGQRCNPGLPPGPFNALRTTLGLTAPSKPYHPLFNGVEYKCGCP